MGVVLKRLLSTLLISLLVLVGISANANPNVDHLSGQGPKDGEFSAWTKVLANGTQMKFYAKYMQPGQKVQFMVQNEDGVYEQFAWNRVDADDLDANGSYKNMQNNIYFIRTMDLKPGKNRVRIYVDGELYWGTKTYSAKEQDLNAPAWTQSASPADVEVCKVPDGRPAEMQRLNPGAISLGTYGMSNVGFPHSPDLLPISGEVNFVVAAVAFQDLPGEPDDVNAFLQEQTRRMTEWSQFWSQGRLKYTFQVVDDWVVLPDSVDNYSADDVSRGNRTVEVHVGLANLLAETIGSRVDWSKADGIFAQFPTSFRAFANDWGGRGDMIQTPEGSKPMFYWGGGTFHNTTTGNITLSKKRSLLWSFWIHEILHSQGMNLHAPGNGWPVGLDRNQYPGGSMKFSGAINSWELFKMGWTRDSQVFCIDGRMVFEQQEVLLTPLEIYGGEYRSIIIRTGEHSGLLVESRRPVGYSKDWSASDAGIMVVDLDTTVMNDRSGESGSDCGNSRNWEKFGYYLPPDGSTGLENSCKFEPFVLKPGEKVSVDGVQIELEFSSSDLDFVRVSQN
ncbi:hypothetical protein N9F59_00605 [Aquiluna sp.]|nr:hypothetical protein [Aquiluna sp.]MDA8992781.1 hypothetical protein [Aquiluna sp.]